MKQKRKGAVVSMRLKSGETFQAILRERKLSQAEVARRAGVSEGFISLLISNDRGCTAATASLIVHALGPSNLTVEALFLTRIQPAEPPAARPASRSSLRQTA